MQISNLRMDDRKELQLVGSYPGSYLGRKQLGMIIQDSKKLKIAKIDLS